MEECVKLRAELKRLSQTEAPTYNDMVVKASALALREHPRANGSYRDGLPAAALAGQRRRGGRRRGRAGRADGVRRRREVARRDRPRDPRPGRARARRDDHPAGARRRHVHGVQPGDVRRHSFTAIINPPQAAILSVGSVEPRAVVREGELLARHTMTITLACDHRILYGADAALFLARIRELLGGPGGAHALSGAAASASAPRFPLPGGHELRPFQPSSDAAVLRGHPSPGVQDRQRSLQRRRGLCDARLGPRAALTRATLG